MSKLDLLTLKQMAEELQVKPSWIYRRTAEGNIPVIRVGKYLRFEPEKVLAWLGQEYGKGSRPQDWIPGYGPADGPEGEE